MSSIGQWILFLGLGTVPLFAQPATMLRDINPDNDNGGIDHYAFGDTFGGPDFTLSKVGDFALFPADDGIHGVELWRSDGTTQGTQLVRDFCPGSCESFSFHDRWTERVVTGNRMVFLVDNPGGVGEVWSTDGTAEGTSRLPTGYSRRIVPWGDRAAFFSQVPTTLHISDGTVAGTSSLDLTAVLGNTFLQVWAEVGSRLLFSGDGALWSTDGTLAGTFRLSTSLSVFAPIRTKSTGSPIVLHDGYLYFSGIDATTGTELWRTDGTVAGTSLVSDLVPGTGSSGPSELARWGGKIYFQACSPSVGCELWTSDGTAAGTSLVADLLPGVSSSAPRQLTAMSSHLYFVATHATVGEELWRTNGTAAGTAVFADLAPGANSSNPTRLTRWDERLLFFATEPQGPRLHVLDGETILPIGGPLLPFTTQFALPPQPLALSPQVALFRGWTAEQGVELWRTDGTTLGTTLVKEINTQSYSRSPYNAFFGDPAAWPRPGVAGTKAVFGATDYHTELTGSGPAPQTDPVELWFSDGSRIGTRRFLTLPENPRRPRFFAVAPDRSRSLFIATSEVGDKAYVSDGTEEGTREIFSFPWPTQPFATSTVGSEFAIVGWTGSDPTLWLSDGTEGDMRSILRAYTITVLGRQGSAVLFESRLNSNSTSELYRTDGSGFGAYERVVPGNPSPSSPASMVALRDRSLFLASTSNSGQELWVTDGTTDGTYQIVDLVPNTVSGAARILGVLSNGQALFLGQGPGTEAELWRTDGTAAGTQPVADLLPGSERSAAFWPGVEASGLLYFFAGDDDRKALWVSDGTTAGTYQLVAPEVLSEELFAVGRGVVFSGWDAEASRELWVSDGTVAGTRRFQDLAPGALPSSPFAFQSAGAYLHFTATDGQHGFEPWSVPLAALPGTAIFGDGFESGNLAAWSAASP